MKYLLPILALLAAPAFAADEQNPMMPVGEVYNGTKTEVVEVGFYKDGKEALIQINGVNHEWNGKTIKTSVRKTDTGKELVTQVEGKDYVALVQRKGGYGAETTELYLPKYDANPVTLIFDKQASSQAQPWHLHTAYTKTEGK